VSLIDKLLTAFIQPLQHDNISTHWQQQQGQYVRSSAAASAAAAAGAIADPAADLDATSSSSSTPSSSSEEPVGVVHRVHCSLNLNTETGRLSARRPNLQNQPAHEKDRYKVR
jgi:DNA polymerase-1